MTAREKNAPGTVAGTGGLNLHEAATHGVATQDSLARDSTGAEQKGLLPEPDAAVDFLERWRPGGPWILTAIEVDPPKTGSSIPTATLTDPDAVRQWIHNHSNGLWNMYFTPNETLGSIGKKPSKGDIAAAVALFCDVDPRAGEPLERERVRITRLFEDWEKNGKTIPLPRPSIVIDSGGGLQGFFLLQERFLLDGEGAVAEVEARGSAIGAAVEGDAVQNVDRIMRLPGTVNWPNAKKRRAGRVPRLARVLIADWQRRYKLEDFPASPRPKASAVSAALAVSPIACAAQVDLSELNLSDRVKALIVTGVDADEPERWADRSRLVLYVLCEMIRADIPQEVMKTIILDPDLGISAHVREQKGADKYADRQIQRALALQSRPGPILRGGPMDWARSLRQARRPCLLHHHEEFLDWDGAAYISVPDATVRAEAWTFLETCRVSDKSGGLQQFLPKPEAVSATLDALRALSHLAPSRDEPPRWLDGRVGPNPLELLPTRSGLLYLPTGDLLPATPELFTRNALDFAHDPAAPEPRRWLAFLRDVWPDADEADCIPALQEFMGYLLTPDTSLQKALLISGPKRSGKGTIGRVMAKLVGEANTVAPSMNSFGRSDFGLEPLLAKQLAIASDVRLSGRTDEAAVAENLLRITGEDRVSVNRKHRQAVEVTLRTRFVLMTNEVPKFADGSGALVSRFIVLPMRQSFFGREDPGLTESLMGELPGILNWAVEGWRRVRANGRIIQPQVGRDVALQMGDLSSPIPAFVREWCEVGADKWAEKEALFAAFREWHRSRMGQDYNGIMVRFARDLYSSMDGQVRDCKPRDGAERIRAFRGIALRRGCGTVMRQDDIPF